MTKREFLMDVIGAMEGKEGIDVDTMNTNYIIYIHTNEKKYKEYKEHWYSLAKTIDRVGFLKTCYNVNYIEIIDACTDEVMITIENGKVAYIAAEVAIRMYNELITNK